VIFKKEIGERMMKKRIAKKILKNKEMLNYSDRQVEKAQKLIDKSKPKEKQELKEN
jgi:hypothetical protein